MESPISEAKASSLGRTDADAISVDLPRQIADRINRRLPATDFKSIDEYVSFVLDQVLSELENDASSASAEAKTNGDSIYTKEDQAVVEQRLRDLGYM